MHAATELPARSILVVDDVDANRVAMRGVLAPLAVEIVEAASGVEALRALGERSFAVVLMDVQMPELDGFETVQLMRQGEHGNHVPVVFVSAVHRDVAAAMRGFGLGAVDFVTKPFEPDIFRAKVAALLDLDARARRLRADESRLRARELAAEHEEATRQSLETANRMKDEFLAVVSHELRTPLTSILGWAELLDADRVPPERARDAVSSILRNARLQQYLIDELLDFSRIVAGKMTLSRRPVNVEATMLAAIDSFRPLAEQRGVSVRLVVESSWMEVEADPARLQQVIGNLLSNAIKFSSPGGRVELVVEREGDSVCMRVVDFGRGIGDDFLPHLFEHFRQEQSGNAREHTGLGLGLAIVRRIVELHGGSVEAQSAGPGHGASFTVRLPVREPADSAPVLVDVVERTERLPGQPRRVDLSASMRPLEALRLLVVDDDRDTLDVIGYVLEDAGARVTVAGSAESAAAQWADGRFDVIISDIGLPGEDGFSLMRRLRALGARVPAIALSAHVSSEDRGHALESGFDAHLGKPVRPDELVEFVAAISRRK